MGRNNPMQAGHLRLFNSDPSDLLMKAREPIGLIAGWGRFPIYFAEKAKRLGIPVVCVGIRGMADRAQLEPLVHRFYVSRMASLGRPIRCFRREGVQRWTMAGKILKI